MNADTTVKVRKALGLLREGSTNGLDIRIIDEAIAAIDHADREMDGVAANQIVRHKRTGMLYKVHSVGLMKINDTWHDAAFYFRLEEFGDIKKTPFARELFHFKRNFEELKYEQRRD